MACVKTKYKDAKQARGAIKRITLALNTGKKPVRAYHCPDCNYYHITSRPRKRG